PRGDDHEAATRPRRGLRRRGPLRRRGVRGPMKAGEEPEPVNEGGDPACWAHLFDDDPRSAAAARTSADDDDVEGDGAVGPEGEALLDVTRPRRAGDEDPT